MSLVLALAVLVGLSLGLLGGGGSILTVPILLYGAHMDEKAAIATSLLVVSATSAFAAIHHARAGTVHWRRGLLFAAGGMTGAFSGGLVARYIPGAVLIFLFAVLMLVTAVAMWRGREGLQGTQPRHGPLPIGRILAEGLVVGLVTGLVGAGGGFLVVPALVLLGGLSMRDAIGTSLVVIALKSAAGFVGYLSHVAVDWPLALSVTGLAILGSVMGARLAHVVPAGGLRRGFSVFVAVMAVVILGQQVA